ncbi:MAG: uracil-DNA glycosylase [candidate division KSB1 bacterium]|nr:uracil-DNA glycosylase [candidate division KSB1 bacterium]MDZ7347126.1 uracil-DNA glycosylase [candidate division KSB1 bacterium]
MLEELEQFLLQDIELYGDAQIPRSALVVDADVQTYAAETAPWQGAETLDALDLAIRSCMRCSLGKLRHQFVFGEGNPNARILLVGEAPGADEDRLGRPFVGEAGELLNKMLAAIGLQRSDVYICNLLKCRPPRNRDPLPEEIAVCRPYLLKQIELINPMTILCLGRFAAQSLLNTDEAISSLRQKWFTFNKAFVLVTYHPAALLRMPQYKRPAWEDLQLFKQKLVELGICS